MYKMGFQYTFLIFVIFSNFVVGEYRLVSLDVGLNTTKPFNCVFVHGHRGHFSQGNSFREVLKGVCDLYSADFLEDISGISHKVLYWQAEFLDTAIKMLSKNSPKKILLICHSMGAISGILAGSMNSEVIEKILTFNSPLDHSPVNTYLAFPILYSKVHKILESGLLNIVSVTGADDYTVPATLTKAAELRNQHYYTISLVAEHLDHNEILTSKNLLSKIPELLKKGFTHELKNWNKEENSNIEELTDCYIDENTEHLDFGYTKIGDPGWYNLKIEKDSRIVIRSKEKIEQICRGIRSLVPIHLQTEDFLYYKISVFSDEEYFFFIASNEIKINQVKTEKCLRIYYKFCGFTASGPVSVKVGSILRTPLLFESSEKVDWIYSRCGNEEIFLKGTDKVLINFHEYCEKVEIWVYSNEVKFILKTPALEILKQVFKEFRLELISFIIAFIFDSTLWTGCWVVLYWALGKYFRYFGLFFLDHLDYFDKRVSLFECFLLALVSIVLGKMLNKVLSVLTKIPKKKLKIVEKKKKWLVFTLLIQPWVGLYITLATNSRALSHQEKKILSTYFILSLPQQFFFFWSILHYNSIPFPDPYDLLTVFPISLFFILPSKELKIKNSLLSFGFILLVQDLLYRGQLFLSVFIYFHLFYPLKNRIMKIA